VADRWKNPLDGFKGPPPKTIVDRLDEVIEATRRPAQPLRDPSGFEGDALRGVRDRIDTPHGFSSYVHSSIIAIGGRVEFDVTESALDILTIFNVDQSLGFPNWDFTPGGPRVQCNGTVLGPIVPGAQYTFPGAKKWELINKTGGSTSLVVDFTLSRGIAPSPSVSFIYGFDPTSKGSPIPIQVRPFDVDNSPYHGVNTALHAYLDRVAASPPSRVLADADGSLRVNPLPAGATRVNGFITGLGGALNNLVLPAPAVGQVLHVLDVSLVAVTPATITRAEFHFNVLGGPIVWHQAIKTNEGCILHHFDPGTLFEGNDLSVDIFQAGVASPWWVAANGYYV